MKKILCITLSLLLMFNTTAVYADEHGGSSGSFDVTPTPAYPIPDDMLDENGRLKPPSMLTFLDKVITAGRTGEVSSELSGLLYSFLGDYDNSDNSISIENGGSTVHFHDTFVDKFNKVLQDKVHALDGFYLLEPYGKSPEQYWKDFISGSDIDYPELKKSFFDYVSKKFDTMIDLLETNNEYQKKLVKSLNEIKAILVTQTVLELFQNRSEETANEAKEKFPTSIPWDIAMVLNAMSADPKPLKVELPIKIESFKINESITVDLTGKEWEQLATTCRYLLSITFILYLIHLSRKLFSKGDDD